MIEWLLKWISFCIFRIFFQQPRHEIKPQIQTPDEIYIAPRKNKFEQKFASLSDGNVDTVFSLPYAEYWKHVCEKNNDLECKWRKRILMEATPRGLVVMYYDAYKRGFAYYSDTCMPYGILNVVAMKYTTLYQCRAFFVDESYFPVGHTSPIQVLDQKDATTTATTATTTTKKEKQILLSGPFLRKGGKESSSSCTSLSTSSTPPAPAPPPPIELRKNRFLNLGKIVNCQLTMPPPTHQILLATSTNAATSSNAAGAGALDYKFWKSNMQNVSASDLLTEMSTPYRHDR